MNVLRIALNDMRVMLKDRMVLVWWFAMPLGFVFILSFMVGDYTQDSTWLPVFQYDDHELADLLIEELRGDGYWIDLKPVEDEHWIDDWSRALVIPADFSDRILRGERIDLILTKGKGRPEKFMAAQTLLVRVLIKLNAAIASIDLVERGWSPETRDLLLAELDQPQALSLEVKLHFSLRPPPTGFAFTLPTYWAIQGIQDVMSFGKSWLEVLPECGSLCAFGVVLTAVSIPLFRWD